MLFWLFRGVPVLKLSKFDARSKPLLILECPHDNSVLGQMPLLLLVVNKERLAYAKGDRAGDAHAGCVDVKDRYFIHGVRGIFFEGDQERGEGVILMAFLIQWHSFFSQLQHIAHAVRGYSFAR